MHGMIETLVLRIRPRPLAAGLEVAVYSGVSETQEGDEAVLDRAGALYAVPATAEGIRAFAHTLVHSSAGTESDMLDDNNGFRLEEAPHAFTYGWESVQLDLLDPQAVSAEALPRATPPASTPSASACQPCMRTAASTSWVELWCRTPLKSTTCSRSASCTGLQ
ncbi:hypothetical protein ABPG75_008711 [Micractinium tetrahymenae]